ncbi:hypothetical protein SAMN05444001_10741 [Parabacteroides chinchillae]|uniref:Uncharacterized protein n=1 Tax=Parabacteroides chinchillae TaxID=871327 RepID=A0A8G2BWB2_9BACT|nr:hypothetical protein SAMN05444001_10741 [Parabacteroides chinchillae]
MVVTLFGIGLSIVGRGGGGPEKWHFTLLAKGILFGIGAGVGQGVGLAFSKLGMSCYMESADPANTVVVQMIPFASTLIRAIVGVSGFLIVMLSMRQGKAFVRSFGDCKAMTAATGGNHIRPVSGCLFLVNGCAIYGGWHCLHIDGAYADNHSGTRLVFL